MVIAKQMEIRANIKEYFDLAYDGNPVIVPRKGKKNVVIISEEEYNRLNHAKRLAAYATSVRSMQRSASAITSPSDYPDVKSFNLAKLDVISGLEPGWNGNDAPAFADTLIRKIRDLLTHITIQPQIFPTALATIQLEYDNARRDHMEIEIGESDTAEVFCVTYDGRETFEDIPATIAGVNKTVKAFYG